MRDALKVLRHLPPLLAVTCVALVLVTAALARQAVTITITTGPSGTTTETTASFAWTLSGADAGRVTRVVCTLGRTITDPCRSPQGYSGLQEGTYSFALHAYAGSTEVGSASRTWTVKAAEPPPAPNPPPPPPPAPVGGLKAPKTVQPGALAVIDASAVKGGGTAYEFDLDGNGAYETKCGKEPTVGVVYPQGGTKNVAVKVTGPGGAGTAKAEIVVAGGAVPAPKGAGGGLGQVGLTAVCNGSDLAAAVVKAYTCPITVVVGVAEATIPAGAPASACFAHTKLLDERFKAPAGQPVYVNGLFVRPNASSQVMLRVFQKTKTVGLTKGSAQVSAYLKLPEIDVDGSGPFLWNVAGPGVVGELGAGADDSFLGLPVPEQAAPITFTAGRQARVGVRVGLPKPLDGVASGLVQLETDNTSGPVLSSFVASFGDIPVGFDSFVSDVKLTYKTVGLKDVWSGGFRLGLAPAGASPVVSSALEITDGALSRAEVTIEKQNPGYGPVGCCVFLTRLKGSYKGPDAKYASQSAFTVEADLTAGPKILGLSVAKLSAAGTLKVACCGVAVEISGNLYLLEKFKLASGWAYFVTGSGNTFVNVEGSANWDMIVFTAKGSISGSFGDFSSPVPSRITGTSGALSTSASSSSTCAPAGSSECPTRAPPDASTSTRPGPAGSPPEASTTGTEVGAPSGDVPSRRSRTTWALRQHSRSEVRRRRPRWTFASLPGRWAICSRSKAPATRHASHSSVREAGVSSPPRRASLPPTGAATSSRSSRRSARRISTSSGRLPDSGAWSRCLGR